MRTIFTKAETTTKGESTWVPQEDLMQLAESVFPLPEKSPDKPGPRERTV